MRKWLMVRLGTRYLLRVLLSPYMPPKGEWVGPRCPSCGRGAVKIGDDIVCGERAREKFSRSQLRGFLRQQVRASL